MLSHGEHAATPLQRWTGTASFLEEKQSEQFNVFELKDVFLSSCQRSINEHLVHVKFAASCDWGSPRRQLCKQAALCQNSLTRLSNFE